MQKKLIALAVAGLVSGGAFAQSNVSFYGIVDAGYLNENFDGADKTTSKIESGLLSTSRLGFKGEEALGNGLKTVFNLEYALAVDTNHTVGTRTDNQGKTVTAARQQNVGLSHVIYGVVLAGYLQSAGYDFAVAASPLAASAFGAAKVLAFDGYSLLNSGDSGRLENAVAYISPTFAGFNVALNHGRLTETANTTGKSDAYANAIGLNYANGPISAGFAYARQFMKNKNISAGDYFGKNSDIEEYGLRGAYDFGVAKLQAAYQTFEAKDRDYGRDSKWVIGATVPVSAAGNVVAEYASLKAKTHWPVAGTFGTAGYYPPYADAKSWTLAYTHALSKRTTAYAGYNQVSSDVANTANEGDVKRVAFGVRHAF
ncbi:porin [Rhodocyclus purpureus]|uniref:porin n=1 Tax=Rhodocyclus purpureus TaxID=1067 RepID=UPI0019138EB3|nr:porin [Rhodocyclus purpureus]MBK5912738.1 hypothetical protein [Rhodocyclus purpureus]